MVAPVWKFNLEKNITEKIKKKQIYLYIRYVFILIWLGEKDAHHKAARQDAQFLLKKSNI